MLINVKIAIKPSETSETTRGITCGQKVANGGVVVDSVAARS
jgi:hypothetical protein